MVVLLLSSPVCVVVLDVHSVLVNIEKTYLGWFSPSDILHWCPVQNNSIITNDRWVFLIWTADRRVQYVMLKHGVEWSEVEPIHTAHAV